MDKPYAPDYVHCEAWSGAPKDNTNFFIYVIADEGCSFCEIYEYTSEDTAYHNYKGPNKDAPIKTEDYVAIEPKAEEGIVYAFDPYQLHTTQRRTGGLRISIDFKVRLKSPYEIDGRMPSEADFVSHNPGQPGLGLYWTLSEQLFQNLQEKYDFELEASKKHGEQAESMRKQYIHKITNNKVF